MNRDHWLFEYSAKTLTAASHTKLAQHVGRLEWWENKKQTVMHTIKSEGLVIDESQAEHLSNSYNRDPSVSVKMSLQRDLRECLDKIREHRGKVEEYLAWMNVLDAQGDKHLDLHHDDWLFFFGKPAVSGEVTPAHDD